MNIDKRLERVRRELEKYDTTPSRPIFEGRIEFEGKFKKVNGKIWKS